MNKFLKIFGVLLIVVVVAFVVIIIGRAVYRSVSYNKFTKTAHGEPVLNAPEWIKILDHDLYCDKFTKSHTHTYLIDDNGNPWYMIPYQKDHWKPLYWDKYGKKKVDKILAGKNVCMHHPMSIDGANLIIQDQDGKINYRKSIREKRDIKDRYTWKDKIAKNPYWNPGWAFNIFPLDHLSKKLQAKKSFPVSISHRGQWNHFVLESESGKKIYEAKPLGSNTTLFIFDERSIRLADPMSPSKFAVYINLPTSLQRAKIASSASTLVITGWNPSSKCWETWKKVVDLDTLGYVPHVAFYKRAGTEWEKLPDMKNRDIGDEIGGSKILNEGDNKKLYTTWFKKDGYFENLVKYSMYLEDDKWKIIMI